MKPSELLERIISGGQTGADRGGLDAGLELGLPIGGWCPKGRRAEDGQVPLKYPMREDDSKKYPARTLANVLEGDATVIFYFGNLELGSRYTRDMAARYQKHHKLVPLDLLDDTEAALGQVRPWLLGLRDHLGRPFVLNVAGNRESRAPGIGARTKTVVVTAVLGFAL